MNDEESRFALAGQHPIRRSFVLLLLFCSASLQAAPPRALPPGQLPNDGRLGPLKDLNGYFPFAPSPTPEQWQERADDLRTALRVALGLWPMPTKTPIELTSTWYFYHDTILLARLAQAIQRDEDGRALNDLAEQIKQAFNEKFLRNGRYATVRNGMLSGAYPSQTSQALPMYFNMEPEDQKESILERLKTAVIDQGDCHVDTGIVGTRYRR